MATDPSTFNTTATLSKVSASWTSSGADGYRIYRKTGTGAFVKIVETNGSTFTHVDIVANYDSAGAEYTYDYKLTAFDNNGESIGLTNTVNMPTITCFALIPKLVKAICDKVIYQANPALP